MALTPEEETKLINDMMATQKFSSPVTLIEDVNGNVIHTPTDLASYLRNTWASDPSSLTVDKVTQLIAQLDASVEGKVGLTYSGTMYDTTKPDAFETSRSTSGNVEHVQAWQSAEGLVEAAGIDAQTGKAYVSTINETSAAAFLESLKDPSNNDLKQILGQVA